MMLLLLTWVIDVAMVTIIAYSTSLTSQNTQFHMVVETAIKSRDLTPWLSYVKRRAAIGQMAVTNTMANLL